MNKKQIAWQECHEFDNEITEIQQAQVDSHAEQRRIWTRILTMGDAYVKKNN